MKLIKKVNTIILLIGLILFFNIPVGFASITYATSTTGADEFWDYTTAQDIAICIIDSGIDTDHEDLVDNIGLKTYVSGFTTAEDPTTDGHGTEVASVAAMKINNGKGYNGISNSKIYSVKIADDAFDNDDFDKIPEAMGLCQDQFTIDVDNGVVDHMIFSFSIGYFDSDIDYIDNGYLDNGYILEEDEHVAIENAIINAALAPEYFMLFAATGNGKQSDKIWFPAAFSDVNAITASTETGGFWWESSKGSNYDSNDYMVDFAAPGKDVAAAKSDGGYYTSGVSGTSMAAPIAAATAALVWSFYPTLDAAGVRDKLILSATAKSDQNKFGNGIINIGRLIASPYTPTGPGSVNQYGPGTWYFKAEDLDSSQVTFSIDWGDGSFEPPFTGAPDTDHPKSHTYLTTGTFHIKLKVKTSDSSWSDFSNYRSVSVTTSGGGGCTGWCPLSDTTDE